MDKWTIVIYTDYQHLHTSSCPINFKFIVNVQIKEKLLNVNCFPLATKEIIFADSEFLPLLTKTVGNDVLVLQCFVFLTYLTPVKYYYEINYQIL